MLTPVSCYYMTSFNYGGKKARDIGLTFRCHLSNIMPDSIFYDSITYLLWRTTADRMNCPSTNTAQKMKFSIKDFFSKCNQIHSLLQIWSHLLKKSLVENFMPEHSRVGISFRVSSVRVCLSMFEYVRVCSVVLNQGCCGSSQYNLPDIMLGLHFKTTSNQICLVNYSG